MQSCPRRFRSAGASTNSACGTSRRPWKLLYARIRSPRSRRRSSEKRFSRRSRSSYGSSLMPLTIRVARRCMPFCNGFAVLTPEIFRPLYLALVRPILEYGLQASSLYLHRDIALMERIQRLATCMFKGMKELPYEERFCRLDLFSLERRRPPRLQHFPHLP